VALNDSDDNRFDMLRQKAKALIEKEGDAPDDIPRDMLGLIQELRLHQMELDIQNEELKSAQRELSELNRIYVERYYENAPCGYVSLDSDGKITQLNRTAVHLMTAGNNQSNMMGMPFSHYLAPNSEEVYFRLRKRSLESDAAQHGELRLQQSDGQPFWVRVDLVTDRDDSGRVSGHRLSMVDVTERKRAEGALRESEARFRSMTDGLPLIVWVHDAQGRQQWVNRRFREFFGVSSSEWADDAWRKLVHPEDADAYIAAFEACVRDKRPFNQQARVRRADGQWRWVESWAEPRFSYSDKFMAFVGTSADITEKKDMEASLQRINQTLEQQVAERTAELENRAIKLQNLAIQLSEAEELERQRIAQLLHEDLQQHLVAVKMKLYTIEPSVAGRRESDLIIGKCIDMLGGAVEKTRKLSRDLSPAGLSFHGLIGVLDMLAVQFKEDYGLSLEISRSGKSETESPAITAFLFRAVKELLFNVVKHSGAEKAQIHIRERNGWIQVRVADDGSGGDLEQVYARRGVEPGFGLFSIEERINALGGRMRIESVPGDGWITTLTVPISAAAVPKMPETEWEADTAAASKRRAPDGVPPLPASRDGIRILVVDDHEAVREGLASLLSQQDGFRVIGQAGDGQAAVDMAREHQPEVILMDVNLPVLDGVEATRSILEKFPGIVVIALSMYDDETTRKKMAAAGAAAYVSKSEAAERIILTIKEIVNA